MKCCFTSTETVGFLGDGSPGRPPRLSHNSWALQRPINQKPTSCSWCMVATGRAMSFTRCRWHSPTQKIQRERKKKKTLEKTDTTERIRSQNNSTFQLGARAQLVGSVGPANPVTGPSFPTTEWTTRYYRTCVTSYTTTTTLSPPLPRGRPRERWWNVAPLLCPLGPRAFLCETARSLRLWGRG